jgi:hypothetical protein
MATAYNAVSSPGLFMRYKRIKELHLHIMRRALNTHRAIKDMVKINSKSVVRNCLIANRKELDC